MIMKGSPYLMVRNRNGNGEKGICLCRLTKLKWVQAQMMIRRIHMEYQLKGLILKFMNHTEIKKFIVDGNQT